MKERTIRLGTALLATIVCLSAATPSRALEAKDRSGRWGAGLEYGLWKRTGGERDYSNLDGFASLLVNRGLSPDWNLQFALRYGFTRAGVGKPGMSAGWDPESGAAIYTTTWQPSARIQRRFAHGNNVTSFLGFGAGIMSWQVSDWLGREDEVGLMPGGDPVVGYDENGDQAELKRTELALTGEIGLEVALGEQWALAGGARVHWTPGNDLDNVGLSSRWGPDHTDVNPAAVDLFVGATFWFGADLDRDDDGIPNSDDICPEEPEDVDGFRDNDGCPDPDNDDDGVSDLQDDCPNEAEDRDGFQDDDGCPDPDNDGDGIVDAQDACPGEAEDLDGFEDDDGCPDLDNDGDGVADTSDRCPDTAAGAEVDGYGCEIVTEAPTTADPAVLPDVPLPAPGQTVTLELAGFASGSARLLPGSEEYLDRWAAVIAADQGIRVEVRGHTDAVGSAELNRELSQRRASHVRDQLIRRGAAPHQITAVGYGEDKPVAPNNTREGRAANRRVELHRVR